ncbi:MAG: PAS domain S-box protein [Mucilaginibacter sp.]
MHPDSDETALLRKSVDEQLFRLLVANIKDYAIFMTDPNGYIMSWNQGAANIKGYAEDEITGKHFSVFYTNSDNERNEPRNNLNMALKHGSYETEGWRVRKDGSSFWANVVFTTLYNDTGHLIGFAKITRDITERKQKEDEKQLLNTELERRVTENTKKIITNELKFRKLIENSYEGITLFDKDLNVTYRSPSSQGITGYSDVARSDCEILDLVHPADKKLVRQLFRELLNLPAVPKMLTFRTRHQKGHYIWIECIFTNMLADKSIASIVCNFRDVTGRKHAEEEIRKKTAQVENILESISDGFIALDKSFRYVYANKKTGEMLGCDPESLIGCRVWDVFPDAVDSATYNAFNKSFETQKYVCHEDYYEPLNLWQENHIYPSPSGLSVFIRNITEKKIAGIEREKITADLVRRNRDLEQFTYIVSHNLRSPVANIKGLSDLLSYSEPGDDDTQTKIALASSISKLDNIIFDLNQILQTGKQGNDKYESVSLPVLIKEITAELQTMIRNNNAAINYDFDAVNEVYTLKGFLYSIFHNLVVNSIKYRRLEVDPVIDVRTACEKDKIIITFADNGKGIDLARHDKLLFGLYKRFDYSVDGKGMGLFMVKMQIESLGGTINVESELDKGTVFIIELPVAAGKE